MNTGYGNLNLKDLIGTPYEVLDCWGVAKKFYEETFCLKIKDYYTDRPDDKFTTKNLIYTNCGDFEAVTKPQFGDILVFRVKGVESHIGVYIGSELFLHSSKHIGCVLDRMSKWTPYLSGIYRHRKNA